jgi:formamidopyrimidine-DNA glycosylase
MPELPEVETVARGLQPLVGLRLRELAVFDRKVWFESELGPEALRGLRLERVSRRGKYLLLRFEKGLTLVQHLRMTGKMLATGNPAIPAAVSAALGKPKGKGLQLRCRFLFEGADYVFFDTRRFGTLTLVRDEEAFFRKKEIAPDPMEEPEKALTVFREQLARSRKPLKAALLDQSIVAGVGNIYADEALHGVGLHPLRQGATLQDPLPLWREILRLLERSIRMGGTTIHDYLNAEGEKGDFVRLLRVYGREGEACSTCGRPVQRIQLAGRSTHFCLHCQPLGQSFGQPSPRRRVARLAGKRRSVSM